MPARKQTTANQMAADVLTLITILNMLPDVQKLPPGAYRKHVPDQSAVLGCPLPPKSE
jgi:hypothetical protein